VKKLLSYAPASIKQAFSRLPFSRFSKIVSLLFWGKEDVAYRGCIFRINPGEFPDYYLYFFNAYVALEINALVELCQNARIFADVGANKGIFSCAVAQACAGIEVFAFEPDHQIAREFCLNAALNPAVTSRIHLVEKAAADQNAEMYFLPNEIFSGSGRLVSNQSGFSKTYRVETVRLDSFFQQIGIYPDVVKIDVEGAEAAVLKGMSGLFSRGFPKAILIEIHFVYAQDKYELRKSMETLLEAAGFTFSYIDANIQSFSRAQSVWPATVHLLAKKKC